MSSLKEHMAEDWQKLLEDEFNKSYFKLLITKYLEEKSAYEVYPPEELIFNALNSTAFEEVKVVILGQDPYHNPGQAHGLSFSVPEGVRVPPSLKNIYKELHDDLNLSIPDSGDLQPWAKEGVLLLNSILSVRQNKPASHSKLGWEQFTDRIISVLSSERRGLVFMLWGNFARSKRVLIDHGKHLVLESPHPSPFSAHTGFFGCQHFSKANRYLSNLQKTPVNWAL